MTVAKPLLETENLRTWFPVKAGIFRKTVGHVKAVEGVSLSIRQGETLGLVGESGCGKSTLVQTILRLLKPTSGSITARFDGKDVNFGSLTRKELIPFRPFVQMVFQDPGGSMNPSFTVGDIIAEPLHVQGKLSRKEQELRVAELLEAVGLKASFAGRYPQSFSGGQKQRIGIARALALKPKLLILDEPVSALDVSVQSQILNLLKDIRDREGLTYLFIAHNLDVVRYMSDRIAVMYLGRIIEEGPRDKVYDNPSHPYTEMLLHSIPIAHPGQKKKSTEQKAIDLPDPAAERTGCDFKDRCPYVKELCHREVPDLKGDGDRGKVACHFSDDLKLQGRSFS